MPTEGTDFHGIDGVKAFSSDHPLSEIGKASNTFMFCVFRAFRGPLFRNLGITRRPQCAAVHHLQHLARQLSVLHPIEARGGHDLLRAAR
jgi:hypothetical protein